MRPDTPDIPRSEPCADVNHRLWIYFCARLGERPAPSAWSEADVVQALDQLDLAARAVNATLTRVASFFTLKGN